MVVVVRVADAVTQSILAKKLPKAAGLLVGLRDGNETSVISALHCSEADLASTTGK